MDTRLPRPTCLRLPVVALTLGVGLVVLLAPLARAGESDRLCDRGFALKRAGQLAEAASVFRQALDLEPHLVRAHWGLAWVLIAQDRKDEAVAEFRQVLALAQPGDLADGATAALKRLGAGPETTKPDTGPPPPPPETPLEAAKRWLASGESFLAIRALRALPPDDPGQPQAQAVFERARQGRRKVPVRAAADALFRAQPGWEEALRHRFDFAAQTISRQVEIDFSLVDIRPWNHQRSTADGLDLVDELAEEVPRDGAEVVLGFLAEKREAATVGGRPEARGVTLGLSPCFTGYGLVSEIIASQGDTQLRIPEDVLRENLVHELGHLFGAVHVRGETVMRANPGAQRVYTFDPLNLAILRASRWVDFDRNLRSLSPEELTRMCDGYAALEAGPATDDGVRFYRGAVLTFLERYREALAEYERVLVASPEDAFTHYNLGELYWKVKDTEAQPAQRTQDAELARMHWKIAETLGRPAWVAALAKQRLEPPQP